MRNLQKPLLRCDKKTRRLPSQAGRKAHDEKGIITRRMSEKNWGKANRNVSELRKEEVQGPAPRRRNSHIKRFEGISKWVRGTRTSGMA